MKPGTRAGRAVVLAPLLLLGAAACAQTRALSGSRVPGSIEREYPVGSVEPLGFASDLDISSSDTLSASRIGFGGLSSDVFQYPMGTILEKAFKDYFVPSLFSAPFEGEVASAFRVEVNLKRSNVALQGGTANANVSLEVRILGPEFKEELFRETFQGNGSSSFDGTTVPEAIWEAAFDAAQEALFLASQDPRLSNYRGEEPLYEFQEDGPSWVVGVLPFEAAEKKAGLDDNTTSLISGKVFDDLARRADRITVLEQARLESLMDEQRFQQSGFTQDVVAQMGQALGARFMIFGEVSYHANQYTITFRMVDVESRRILASPTKFSPKAAPRQLLRLTRSAVNELLRRLDGMP